MSAQQNEQDTSFKAKRPSDKPIFAPLGKYSDKDRFSNNDGRPVE